MKRECFCCLSTKGPFQATKDLDDTRVQCVNKDACMARMSLQDDDYDLDNLQKLLSLAKE